MIIVGIPDIWLSANVESPDRQDVERVVALVGGNLTIESYDREYYSEGRNPWFRVEPKCPCYEWIGLSRATVAAYFARHPLYEEKDLRRFNLLEAEVEPIGFLAEDKSKLLVRGLLPFKGTQEYHIIACHLVRASTSARTEADDLAEAEELFQGVPMLSKASRELISVVRGSDSGDLGGLTFGDLAQIRDLTKTTLYKQASSSYAGWTCERLQVEMLDGSQRTLYSTSVGYSEGYQFDIFSEFPESDRFKCLRLFQKEDASWSGWYFGGYVGQDYEVDLLPEEAAAICRLQWGGDQPKMPEILTEFNSEAVDLAERYAKAILKAKKIWHGPYKEKYSCVKYGVNPTPLEVVDCPIHAELEQARFEGRQAYEDYVERFDERWIDCFECSPMGLSFPEMRELRNRLGEDFKVWMREA